MTKDWEKLIRTIYFTGYDQGFHEAEKDNIDIFIDDFRSEISHLQSQTKKVIKERIERLRRFKDGKPVIRKDYLCTCGYEWEECECEYNNALVWSSSKNVPYVTHDKCPPY